MVNYNIQNQTEIFYPRTLRLGVMNQNMDTILIRGQFTLRKILQTIIENDK